MTAHILTLPLHRQPAVCESPALHEVAGYATAPRHVWHGASGRRYSHAVYSLVECPPLSDACYTLVHRDAQERRTALHIGLCDHAAPTLNLARIRQRGAMLGANEVHVHVLPGHDAQRLAACDLRAAAFSALAPEPLRAIG
jgi:hypothetical protein